MHTADCHTRLLRMLVGALLCLSSLRPAPAAGSKLPLSMGVAKNWAEMISIYRESSVYMFHRLLAAMQMDVSEFARRSGQHEDRLRGYMEGELSLDEIELDKIMHLVNDVREIVRKFYGGSAPSSSLEASLLLYGVPREIEGFRQHAQIETVVQELRASGEKLTAEQERLVNKVDAISADAFVRLKHAVTLNDIKSYGNKEQTSAEILVEILAQLSMDVPELSIRSEVYAARFFAHQRGEIIFNDEELQKINTALEGAIDTLSVKTRLLKRPRWPQPGKRVTTQAETKRHLKVLLRRFSDAVRVERYLRDRAAVD